MKNKLQNEHARHDENAENKEHSAQMKEHSEMSGMNQEQMMLDEHRENLWVHLAIVALGVWLVSSPVTFGYQQQTMIWSDVISGALLVVFGLLSLNAKRYWSPWAACFVGLWLGFAPLVFWATSAAAYVNDTLVATMVIAFSVLVPGMPGMMMFMKEGPETPPGWSYNPSAWLQRAPIIALGFIGWFGSRYLAAYQLGYISARLGPVFRR